MPTIRENEEIQRAIEQMSREIAEAMRFSAQRKHAQKELDLQSLTKVKDFMSLPADKRKALLLDPSFRQEMIRVVDPESFATGKAAKKTMADKTVMQQKETSVLALGEETATEQLARQKEIAAVGKSQAEAALVQQKQRISSGVETATPMSLLMTGDVKDPMAAALFSLVPQETLKNLALAEKKMGPIYQNQQKQEWYKWGIDQGLPPGVAMQTSFAIAAGEWDKVPVAFNDGKGKMIQVRGKAEQELATSAMLANARVQEVQNTISSSIATSAAQLAERAGIPLDQARANIVAVRSGKPTPFPTPNLEDMVKLDMANKKLEIEKNTQSILNDKSGIGMIRESLNTMLSAYKEEKGTVFNSAASDDLGKKIVALQEVLAQRLGERYGIKLPEYGPTWGDTVKGAMAGTWNLMKTTGAYGKAVADTVDETMKQVAPNQFQGESGRVPAAAGKPQASRVRTPEQEAVLSNLYTSFTKALTDDSVPNDQKEAIRKYITEKLEPVFQDPSKFNDLFVQQPPQQEF